MRGLMQDWPLRQNTILDHANIHHGKVEIITRAIEGEIHTTNYSEVHLRARKLSQALIKLGVKPGDVIGRWRGTLIAIWNYGMRSRVRGRPITH